MADRAELDELARRYLDLWQDQVSALADDPAFAESLNRMMQAMGLGPGAAWPAPPGWPGPGSPARSEDVQPGHPEPQNQRNDDHEEKHDHQKMIARYQFHVVAAERSRELKHMHEVYPARRTMCRSNARYAQTARIPIVAAR